MRTVILPARGRAWMERLSQAARRSKARKRFCDALKTHVRAPTVESGRRRRFPVTGDLLVRRCFFSRGWRPDHGLFQWTMRVLLLSGLYCQRLHIRDSEVFDQAVLGCSPLACGDAQSPAPRHVNLQRLRLELQHFFRPGNAVYPGGPSPHHGSNPLIQYSYCLPQVPSTAIHPTTSLTPPWPTAPGSATSPCLPPASPAMSTTLPTLPRSPQPGS